MSSAAISPPARSASLEQATLVAVVGALSATTMLFASLVSAYLVRRSFPDWRPWPALWPFVLLVFALLATAFMEVGSRSRGTVRARAFLGLVLASGLYLAGALSVIAGVMFGESGLSTPFNSFVVLLLSVHVAHALLGGAFSVWTLRPADRCPTENGILLARLVTHFLTVLLFAIVFVLFGLQ